ncbi:MAG TPA: serine/threonine-protein kinase, partial [Polyangia bacterium]
MDTVARPAVPDLARSLVGRVLCNHRLVTELGSGGMGHVFYAEHLVIGRRAAIKVLKPEVSRDETVVARFLNEARAVNEIRHPNVIEITDIGREADLHYIVMNFLEGETLGERIERDKIIDEDTVLRMTRQVVSALSAAHQRGIIHRDLKPD